MENSGHRQFPSGFEPIADFLRLLQQQMADQVRANDIVTAFGRHRQPSEVSTAQQNRNTIAPDVLMAGADRLWIVVPCHHRIVSQFRRRNGQDPRAAANIQERLLCSRPPEARKLLQAEQRRRMLPCSKT